MAHAVIALVLCLVFHWSAGMIGYGFREVTEVEKVHNWDWKKFDWKGFLAPTVVSILILII